MKECSICQRCYPDEASRCAVDDTVLTGSIPVAVVLDDRYLLERRLGQGGMGAVFKARHVFLKTEHAVKVILPTLVGNDTALVTRFRQEAMAAAAIRHRNIIAVTDFGVVNGTLPYLVMEFVNGQSLHDLITKAGRLPLERALQLMEAMAAGVAAAHRRGVVHRDLKPLNIMIRDGVPTDEGVKVLDFGLAKIKSTDLLGSFVVAKTAGIIGSPFYMAPEQWSEEEPDQRADIYSLGIILYQMLAGDVPFKAQSLAAIMRQHLTGQPPAFSLVGVHVPEAVEAVIHRAIEKDPADRPESLDEFMHELRRAAAKQLIVPVSKPTQVDPQAETVRELPVGKAAEPAEPRRSPLHSIMQRAVSDVRRSEQDGPAESPAPPPTLDPAAAVAAAARPAGSPPPPPEPPGPSGPAQQRAEEEARQAEAARAEAAREEAARVEAAQAEAARAEAARAAEVSAAAEAERARPTGPLTIGARARRTEPAALNPLVGGAAPAQEVEAVGVPPATPPAGPQSVSAGDTNAEQLQSLWQLSLSSFYNSASDFVAAQKPSFLLMTGGAAVLFIFLLGAGGATMLVWLRGSSNSTATENSKAAAAKVEVVPIPGGTFKMGRSDIRLDSAELVNQYPAHPVTVAPFYMDKTEVTNAEYADFVRETKYAAPDSWADGAPPPGRERWPVTNVTKGDAEAFAAWRSKRDGVQYRLPTEEEWEFAARGGGMNLLYPWGAEWRDGLANVGGASPQPVGSFPQGASKDGVLDLIGNVWEWTSSKNSLYPGNDAATLVEGETVITRGGSYSSKPGAAGGITATRRRATPPNTKHQSLGFRLVRSAQ